MAVRITRGAGWVLVALMATWAPAAAQVFTGRIDVTVEDATGGRLPGVTVELTGPVNQTAVTDQSGEAHFLNLPVGRYEVVARLGGFRDYRNTNVPVAAGAAVPLSVRMGVAGTQETVEVTAESPIVDVRRQSVSTNVTVEELQSIPSARDPWVVMQTVPGVIMDRVNVGGAESGQQSNYQAKGAGAEQNTWNLDGIPITDMAATGSSPTYYDFDMFQEMQVTTGGADVTNPSPGVHLNLVMKSGTNVPHGSARVFFQSERLQSNNLSDELAAAIGGTSKKGNRTDQYADYGGEVGGPILRDKWWAWGSFGKTDVRIRTLNEILDRTILENYGFKTHAQLTEAARAGFTYFRGDKLKFGRSASPLRPAPTTWDQSGPTNVYKTEGNLVVGQNLFLTGRYAFSDMGFSLTPKGGMDANVFRDVNRVWQNSFVFYTSNRPQHAALADGNWFRGRHEVKFGFSWRRAVVESLSRWPGTKQYSIHLSSYPRNGLMLPIFTRDQVRNNTGTYTNAYLSDVITFDRFSLSLGARFDRSASSLEEAFSAGSPIVPEVLPDLRTPAKSNVIDWNSLTPRVGINYALDENRRTLVRASYAMFAGQLGAAESGFVAGPSYYSYVYYLAIDANRDGVAQRSELITGPLGSYGFDLENPNSVESVNRIGEDYKAPRTHEFLIGLDREVMNNLGVSGTFSFRRFNDVSWNPEPLIGVRQRDYVQAGTVTGNVASIGNFRAPYFAPRPGVLPPGNGREKINRPGYYQRYWGFEMSAVKRMSNRWMARLGFSTNDHREYFTDPDISIEDPTRFPNEPKRDGGVVVTETTGSGKSDVFMVLPKYQFTANGLYQGPFGINLGANLVMRQGFGKPYYAGDTEVEDPSSGGLKDVLIVDDIDDERLPTVTSLDIRLEKVFAIRQHNLIFDFDIFNVLNTDTVLGRQFDVNAGTGPTGADRVLEIMNPRIARLGLRWTF